MSQEKKYLRKVEPKDIGLLYKWTNDKDVRQNSFNTEPITYEEHKKWFEKQMSKDMGMFYILMVDDMPVGQIRLLVKGDLAEVNYNFYGCDKENMKTLLEKECPCDLKRGEPITEKLLKRVLVKEADG